MRKIVGAAAALLGILLVVGGCAHDPGTSGPNDGTPASIKPLPPADDTATADGDDCDAACEARVEARAEADAAKGVLGVPFKTTTKAWEVTVVAVTEVGKTIDAPKDLGYGTGAYRSKNGHLFVVEIKIRNMILGPLAYAGIDDMMIEDATGRLYESAHKNTGQYEYDDVNTVMANNVQPNGSQTVTVLFDVPSTAKDIVKVDVADVYLEGDGMPAPPVIVDITK